MGTAARLVVVTKTHPVEKLREAYAAGARVFGENRVQEMAAKQPELPADVEWHQIGQSANQQGEVSRAFRAHRGKRGQPAPAARARPASRPPRPGYSGPAPISHCPGRNQNRPRCPRRKKCLQSADYQALRHVRLTGVMGIATNSPDEALVRGEFRQLRQLFRAFESYLFRAG
ncbi:MAG: YggS family pyridoxal phosphate-dependent enzyme [Hymenobacter sp.]